MNQRELYNQAERQIADANETFLELVNHPTNPLTKKDLEACIKRRPERWARFSNWLDKLP